MTDSVERTAQSGVGMIEVLVALLVLAIGVLGYAGLQLAALKGAEVAHVRAMGTGIAQDLLERMQANPEGDYTVGGLWDEGYEMGATPQGWLACINGTCSVAEMVSWDVNSVRWTAANTLPGGRVLATPCPFSPAVICVAVSWGEQSPDDCITNDGVLDDLGAECVVMEVAR